MNKYKVLYITTEGFTSTVFRSQVYSLSKRLRNEYGIDIKIFNVQPILTRFRIDLIKYTYDDILKSIPKILGIKYWVRKIKDYLISQNVNKWVLHCRNPEAAYLGVLTKKILRNEVDIEVIYDVRGYPEGEHNAAGNEEKSDYYRILNEKLFNEQIYYSFISQDLLSLYERVQESTLQKRSIICPSAYDDKVFSPGELTGNYESQKIQIVYVGGNQSYQNIQHIINYISEYENLHMTIITHKKIESDYCDNIDFKNNLTQSEINEVCKSMHYGIIQRDEKKFNIVATPTKISEYWGMGLKVIAINNACAYTEVIKQNSLLGKIVQENKVFQLFKSLKHTSNKERRRIQSFAKNNYSMSKNLEKYLNFYETI